MDDRLVPGTTHPVLVLGSADAVTGAPRPSVRASGIGSIALGGFYLATAWLWFAEPDDSTTAAAALALSLCFLCCTVAFNQWAGPVASG